MDDREAKLPKWAQDLIADLRRQVQSATDPLTRELAKVRPELELLRRRNGALTELLECAARGGHETAKTIADIIGTHGLTLTPDE